jgi:hypothetical protein
VSEFAVTATECCGSVVVTSTPHQRGQWLAEVRATVAAQFVGMPAGESGL